MERCPILTTNKTYKTVQIVMLHLCKTICIYLHVYKTNDWKNVRQNFNNSSFLISRI